MNKNILIPMIVLAAAMSGCSMIPQYSRPASPVPDHWPSGPAYATSQPSTAPTDVTGLPWQKVFLDEKLQKVIQMSLDNNRDLRIAALNVLRARAVYDIQRAELLPVVNADATFTRQRLPKDLSGIGQPMTSNQFGGNLFFSAWEIDFFGRIRSLVAASLQQYMATEQARRNVQILLISGVARSYLALAADRENLTLAETTLKTQHNAYNLVKRRLDHGLVPELDLHRAQTQVDIAKVDVARWTQIVAQEKNALDLLVGTPVSDDLLPAKLGSVKAIREVSVNLSSDVLLQRPDIIQAENLLKAANANIGAARANFFPRISLTSAIGTGSDELSGLFKSGSMAWTFAPQVVMPIFDPRTWSALKVTKVDKKAAVAQYEKAIQTAFREVADTLAVLGTVDDQISAQESLVHASAETYRLSTARYIKGVDSYLSVLDAQQSLYTAQRNLVLLRLEKIANQVRLYAVLGGGDDSAQASDATMAVATGSRQK
jgi:multidrug efflux system outer membrane protein